MRVKTSALIGRQSLKLYKNWKGDEAAINREWKRNHEIGLEFNMWKGVLVCDDDGKVMKRIMETEKDSKYSSESSDTDSSKKKRKM